MQLSAAGTNAAGDEASKDKLCPRSDETLAVHQQSCDIGVQMLQQQLDLAVHPAVA